MQALSGFKKHPVKKALQKLLTRQLNLWQTWSILPAMGMAKSALLLDPDCGCAQLVLAAISSPNPNWGSQKSKLSAINVSKLSAEEKSLVWFPYDTSGLTDLKLQNQQFQNIQIVL